MIIEKAGEVRGYSVKNEFKAHWLRMVISGGKITTQFKPTEKDERKVVGQSDILFPGDLRAGIMTGALPKRPNAIPVFGISESWKLLIQNDGCRPLQMAMSAMIVKKGPRLVPCVAERTRRQRVTRSSRLFDPDASLSFRVSGMTSVSASAPRSSLPTSCLGLR